MVPSKDQIAVHRDFFVAIADLSRIVMNAGSSGQNGAKNMDSKPHISSWGEECDRIDKAITTLRKENEKEAVNVIESVLKCCNNILSKSTFPRQWVVMRMVEAEVAMRGLSWFGSTLKRNYLSKSFSAGCSLWKQWLSLGMLFLSNDDFALEDMNPERADIIRKHYGDVRNISIKKLTVAWDVLTPHRADLADTMIKDAIQASASEVEEIQQFAERIYVEMIKSEFERSHSLNTVETYTVNDHVHILETVHFNVMWLMVLYRLIKSTF